MAVTRHGENRYDAARRSRKQVPRPPDPGSPDPFTNAKEHGARNVDAPERSPSLAGEGAHQPPPRRNDPLMLPGIELDDDPLRFPRHRSPGERDPGNPFPWLELPGQGRESMVLFFECFTERGLEQAQAEEHTTGAEITNGRVVERANLLEPGEHLLPFRQRLVDEFEAARPAAD